MAHCRSRRPRRTSSRRARLTPSRGKIAKAHARSAPPTSRAMRARSALTEGRRNAGARLPRPASHAARHVAVAATRAEHIKPATFRRYVGNAGAARYAWWPVRAASNR